MSPLKLMQLFMKPSKSIAREEASEVGRIFREMPRDEYFGRAKAPASSIEEAERLYNLRLKSIHDNDLLVEGDNGWEFGYEAMPTELIDSLPPLTPEGSPGSISHYTDILTTPQSLISGGHKIDSGLEEYLRRLDPQAPLYGIEASASSKGGGVGTRTYPALYDILSGQEGRYNLNIPGLTDVNSYRKSLNSADAILRNPALADKLIPHRSQLWDGLSVSDYMDLPPDSKVGSLLLGAGKRAMGEIDGLKFYHPDNPDFRKFDDPFDLMEFSDASRGLTGHGGISVGPKTLKKLSLIESILDGSYQAMDPTMRQGLGFKRGGLAQVCSCSKH